MNFERRDLATDAWLHLKADILTRIEALHIENESLTMDHDKTQGVRGRIAELRKLLAVEIPPPVMASDRPRGRRALEDDPAKGQ